MPRSIKSCYLEAAGPFLFWRDPLGDSTQLRVCPPAVRAAGHIMFAGAVFVNAAKADGETDARRAATVADHSGHTS
jgi:hypothetical protein